MSPASRRLSAGPTNLPRMALAGWNGTICLQGGGEFSAACAPMDADLLVRSGGPVVVTALAGAPGAEYAAATANGVRHFRALGATEVVAAPDAREHPREALAALRTARLLVLPGGSPSRLLDALRATGVEQVIDELLAADGVVLGASAGAMVLCAWTVLPDRDLQVVEGLGVVPDAIVLPHWGAWPADRLRSIEAAVPAGTTVLGLPEQSGVLLADGQVTAVGVAPTALPTTGEVLTSRASGGQIPA